MPVAVNWTVVPFAMEDLAALMLIDCSVAGVTDRVTLFDGTPLLAAVMLLEPMACPVARPVASMVTTAGLELVQLAELLKSCVLPSLNVPVAVN